MQIVRQEDFCGCVIACMAMVLGRSYESIKGEVGDPGNGFAYVTWKEYLGRHGYAVQMFFRYDPLTRSERVGWPLKPWTDVHFCAVDGGYGAGSHLVVLLRDGRVLDPMSDEPRMLSDYSGISYMAGLYKVGETPFGVNHTE